MVANSLFAIFSVFGQVQAISVLLSSASRRYGSAKLAIAFVLLVVTFGFVFGREWGKWGHFLCQVSTSACWGGVGVTWLFVVVRFHHGVVQDR
jgi:hypothetical protein